jgi:hypothetical protein
MTILIDDIRDQSEIKDEDNGDTDQKDPGYIPRLELEPHVVGGNKIGLHCRDPEDQDSREYDMAERSESNTHAKEDYEPEPDSDIGRMRFNSLAHETPPDDAR